MRNVDALRALMREHKLTRKRVADILAEATGLPHSLDTVHAWLKPADNRSHRNMPDAKLRLLVKVLKR